MGPRQGTNRRARVRCTHRSGGRVRLSHLKLCLVAAFCLDLSILQLTVSGLLLFVGGAPRAPLRLLKDQTASFQAFSRNDECSSHSRSLRPGRAPSTISCSGLRRSWIASPFFLPFSALCVSFPLSLPHLFLAEEDAAFSFS